MVGKVNVKIINVTMHCDTTSSTNILTIQTLQTLAINVYCISHFLIMKCNLINYIITINYYNINIYKIYKEI